MPRNYHPLKPLLNSALASSIDDLIKALERPARPSHGRARRLLNVFNTGVTIDLDVLSSAIKYRSIKALKVYRKSL